MQDKMKKNDVDTIDRTRPTIQSLQKFKHNGDGGLKKDSST